MDNSKYWINKLGLIKHPEGGYYKETYISTENINHNQFEGTRSLATSIYFLLNSGEVSHFHSLKSDELWYFHAGTALTIYVINKDGGLQEHKLGLNIEKGEMPQIIVPAGSIFGSAMNEENSYSLVGCMVSPGFDFRDFILFKREELLNLYPQHKDIINKLTINN